MRTNATLSAVIALFCFPLNLLAATSSVVRDAKIYPLGKTDQPPAFLQKTTLITDEKGITHESTTITDAQGKMALTQESDFDGPHLINQHVRQFQTGKAYTVHVEAGLISFKTFSFDGQTETPSAQDKPQSEKIEEPFLTGPTTDGFIRSAWAQLMAGDTVHVRLGVLELAETVGFKFWKEEPQKGLITIRMKPSSVFIGMAVKSIDILFDPSTKLMMRYMGRTPLRILDQGKLVPLDGDVVYR